MLQQRDCLPDLGGVGVWRPKSIVFLKYGKKKKKKKVNSMSVRACQEDSEEAALPAFWVTATAEMSRR